MKTGVCILVLSTAVALVGHTLTPSDERASPALPPKSTIDWWPIYRPGTLFTPDWWKGTYGLWLNISHGRRGKVVLPADLDFSLQLSWAGVDTVIGSAEAPTIGKLDAFSLLFDGGLLWPASPGVWVSS